MIRFFLLISRQGKVRLAKWYATMTAKEKAKATRDATTNAIGRPIKLSNIVDWKGYKMICKRYASLYFVVCIDKDDNELIALEAVHHFVEVLDRYFENVCELDLIFNFHKAYFLLDEVFLSGELAESSKKVIVKQINAMDSLAEDTVGINDL